MDESLSDFQQPKKCFRESKKPVPKASTSKSIKTKAKSKTKKVKGQKDIRAALKPKISEIVSYAEDFAEICKHSGIDVDSEQLQVAIALSKSLHDTNESEDGSQGSVKSLSTQERSSKIRTTLLEYGFKVPEIKINVLSKKKGSRKISKLILVTETEKQQLIADKFAQVLFSVTCNKKSPSKCQSESNEKAELYLKATNTYYHEFNEVNSFYIDGLIDIMPNSTGSLLKDWSAIPGRPQSPLPITLGEIDFKTCIKNQNDLDVMLSGNLKLAQNLIRLKKKTIDIKTESIENKSNKAIDLTNCGVIDQEMTGSIEKTKSKNNGLVFDEPKPINNLLIPSVPLRSYSPDIFDDFSTFLDNSATNINPYDPLSPEDNLNSEQLTPKSKVLNLTNKDNCSVKLQEQQQEKENVTKNKTNDFMDLTECVNVSMLKTKSEPVVQAHVDLTQYSEETMQETLPIGENYSCLYNSKTASQIKECADKELFDSQTTSSSVESLPVVLAYSQKHFTIDTPDLLKECDNKLVVSLPKQSACDVLQCTIKVNKDQALDHVDLTHSPDSSVSEKSGIHNHTFDYYEYHHSDLHSPSNSDKDDSAFTKNHKTDNVAIQTLQHFQNTDCEENKLPISSNEHFQSDANIDLTQLATSSEETVLQSDFSCNIDQDIDSNDSEINCSNNLINRSPQQNQGHISTDYDEIDHDLTNLEDGMSLSSKVRKCTEVSPEVSVVYDLAMDDFCVSNHNMSASNSPKAENNLDTSLHKVASFSSPSSKNGFEISDEEFDYSMQKADCMKERSRISNQETSSNYMPEEHYDYDYRDITVHQSITEQKPLADCSINHTIDDISLPEIEIKGTRVNPKSPETKNKTQMHVSTPIQKSVVCTNATPSNSEFIIKTAELTPMLDYASLDTPDRNMELEKYGIKPFKRKRAIQILEHLYYQTHPLIEVESTQHECKRRKPDAEEIPESITNLPIYNVAGNSELTVKQHELLPGATEKRDAYEIANEKPVLKEVQCEPEDWIFQKREKAKVSGCRVPLHIAFHNFVTCRRALQETILRYEPVNIEIVHKGLVKEGHRYDPKDLLKFMDKKCITVKTADANNRNANKKPQRR